MHSARSLLVKQQTMLANASAPCCSSFLIGTNFMSGRDAASQIAAASAASFFLPFFTNGLTASGAMSFTSCPSAVNMRAQWCPAPHASITTVQASCFLRKMGSARPFATLRLISVLPPLSTAWTWKTDLAVSRPIMLMLIAGGSLLQVVTTLYYGTPMPLGAVHPIFGGLPRRRRRMTRLEDRQILVRDIEQARADGARLAPACALAGIDAGTPRRWKAGDGLTQGDRRPDADRPIPSHALSEAERARIIEVANEPRFAETPPARIVPALADEGIYIASESSFHRVLRAHGQMNRRGRAQPPRASRPPTTHIATVPVTSGVGT